MIQGLAELGDVEALARVLEDPSLNEPVRKRILLAIGYVRSSAPHPVQIRIIPHLLRLVRHDPELFVRREAAWVLRYVGQLDPAQKSQVVKVLKEAVYQDRQWRKTALCKFGKQIFVSFAGGV